MSDDRLCHRGGSCQLRDHPVIWLSLSVGTLPLHVSEREGFLSWVGKMPEQTLPPPAVQVITWLPAFQPINLKTSALVWKLLIFSMKLLLPSEPGIPRPQKPSLTKNEPLIICGSGIPGDLPASQTDCQLAVGPP